MKNELDAIKKMHEEQGRQKIQSIRQKIDTTKYNMEISKEIIAETPSDKHEENLKEKNTNRKHAIAGLRKEIRDIEQALDQE